MTVKYNYNVFIKSPLMNQENTNIVYKSVNNKNIRSIVFGENKKVNILLPNLWRYNFQ